MKKITVIRSQILEQKKLKLTETTLPIYILKLTDDACSGSVCFGSFGIGRSLNIKKALLIFLTSFETYCGDAAESAWTIRFSEVSFFNFLSVSSRQLMLKIATTNFHFFQGESFSFCLCFRLMDRKWIRLWYLCIEDDFLMVNKWNISKEIK